MNPNDIVIDPLTGVSYAKKTINDHDLYCSGGTGGAGISGISTTNSTYSSSTWNTGYNDPKWSPEAKKSLVKVGFKYNKATSSWELNVTATVKITELEDLLGDAVGTPSDDAIAAIKEAKEQILEKLTAKIVLTELIKPREIKE